MHNFLFFSFTSFLSPIFYYNFPLKTLAEKQSYDSVTRGDYSLPLDLSSLVPINTTSEMDM